MEVGGGGQQVKWADGSLHIDGAVTQSWFNDFGTLTLSLIWESDGNSCVWVGAGVSSSRHFALSSATSAVTGAAERDSHTEVAAQRRY